MADRKGFEPSRRSPAYALSRRAPSTTRPPVRRQSYRKSQGRCKHLFGRKFLISAEFSVHSERTAARPPQSA